MTDNSKCTAPMDMLDDVTFLILIVRLIWTRPGDPVFQLQIGYYVFKYILGFARELFKINLHENCECSIPGVHVVDSPKVLFID